MPDERCNREFARIGGILEKLDDKITANSHLIHKEIEALEFKVGTQESKLSMVKYLSMGALAALAIVGVIDPSKIGGLF